MGLSYTEFATTGTNLLADIRAAILASSDWSRPNAAGKPSLYKATTDRGADMIVDLEDAASTLYVLKCAVWGSHDGTTGANKNAKYINWRPIAAGNSTMTSSSPLYVTLSCGKNHFFLMVEGPKAGDPGVYTTAYGSWRNYLFLSDLVPYHTSDTQPVVVVGGASWDRSNSAASVSNNDHQIQVSKGKNATINWSQGKIVTLDFPTMFTSDTIAVTRQCAWDNNYYISPYVIFDDLDGMRGRLAMFHFAGYNQTSDASEVASTPVGSKVLFNGQWYKLIAVNKTDANSAQWGPFGSVSNATGATAFRSIVVAIPTTAP